MNVFRQARMDAAQKMDEEMVHADLVSGRVPGDATLPLGELEALEETMAPMDAAEDVEETAEDEEGAPPGAGNPAFPAPLVEDAGGALEGVGAVSYTHLRGYCEYKCPRRYSPS